MKINTKKVMELLAERGISNTDLATNAGICRQNISIVLGRGTCAPKTAGKIAKGLGVSVAEIMKGE